MYYIEVLYFIFVNQFVCVRRECKLFEVITLSGYGILFFNNNSTVNIELLNTIIGFKCSIRHSAIPTKI